MSPNIYHHVVYFYTKERQIFENGESRSSHLSPSGKPEPRVVLEHRPNLVVQSAPFLANQEANETVQRKRETQKPSDQQSSKLYFTSSWTHRKWTDRQNLLFSTVAPGMDSVLAVRSRYAWRLQGKQRARHSPDHSRMRSRNRVREFW
jgi:hypothetical protein